jgi:lipopolysaccharide heptosyltransferase II
VSAPLDPRAKVLVRVPNWLGDLVQAEPVLRAIELHLLEGGPEGTLTLAGPARLLSLFEGRFPGAPRIEPGDRSRWRGHDAALLLTNSFESAWTAFWAGIPRRVGYARELRGGLLTDALRPAREAGRVPLGLGLAGRFPRHLPRPFGASCSELAAELGVLVRDPRPRLGVPPVARERVLARLAQGGIGAGDPFALLNVGSRPRSAKGYPPRAWGEVSLELARRTGMPQVLVCGPGEEAALEEALSIAGSTRVLAWPDTLQGPKRAGELGELAALVARARVLLTSDSGPRHLAVAFGTPVAVAAGPTDPRHTADRLASTRLVRVEVPCGPCHRERCPIPERDRGFHACMRRIEPSALVDAAELLLRYHAPRGEP